MSSYDGTKFTGYSSRELQGRADSQGVRHSTCGLNVICCVLVSTVFVRVVDTDSRNRIVLQGQLCMYR